MSTAQKWKDYLTDWPTDIPRRGVLVTNYNDQVQFDALLTHKDFVLLNRNAPDATGARQIIVPYENISALKILDVVGLSNWEKVGFAGPAVETKSTKSASRSARAPRRPAE